MNDSESTLTNDDIDVLLDLLQVEDGPPQSVYALKAQIEAALKYPDNKTKQDRYIEREQEAFNKKEGEQRHEREQRILLRAKLVRLRPPAYMPPAPTGAKVQQP